MNDGISASCVVHKVKLKFPFGFHHLCSAGIKWSNQGYTCFVLPGHDPSLEITVFGDISTNPVLSTPNSDLNLVGTLT